MTFEHVSAGGVIVDTDQKKVLLLHRLTSEHWSYDSWHLPKGTQQPGESLEETALREVEEETGYKTKIIENLGTLPSTYEREGRLVNKITHYFLMVPISRSENHDQEHDEIEWCDFDLAKERLSEFPIWEKEEEILDIAEQKL